LNPSHAKLCSTIQVRPATLNARCLRLTICKFHPSRRSCRASLRLSCPASAMTVRMVGQSGASPANSRPGDVGRPRHLAWHASRAGARRAGEAGRTRAQSGVRVIRDQASHRAAVAAWRGSFRHGSPGSRHGTISQPTAWSNTCCQTRLMSAVWRGGSMSVPVHRWRTHSPWRPTCRTRISPNGGLRGSPPFRMRHGRARAPPGARCVSPRMSPHAARYTAAPSAGSAVISSAPALMLIDCVVPALLAPGRISAGERSAMVRTMRPMRRQRASATAHSVLAVRYAAAVVP
jgi:hypothetical protein